MNAFLECQTACPFCDEASDTCSASCFSMRLAKHTRLKYCYNEDYDDCPIYLVKNMTSIQVEQSL